MAASWSSMKLFYNLHGVKLYKSHKLWRMYYSSSRLRARCNNPNPSLDELPQAYNPSYVESKWCGWWEDQGFFCPECQDIPENTWLDRKQFVMCLPPPNVTGTLHLGHALTNAVQDAIVRWHRMHGVPTLWIPGCDHAGIATQVVVEKHLWRNKKLTKYDIGRENFVEEVWKWKNEKGNTIYDQMKRLGSSLDWRRSVFTMDERLQRAVQEAFIKLHTEGLIYRRKRVVNWSCQLKSAISDAEVENIPLQGRTKMAVPGYPKKIEFGKMVLFAYPLENSDEEIVVSTTRLETMLGDVAVAVHPDDNRYKHLHGKHILHPLQERRIPIICDEFANMDFGTGAVKVTPAHDHNDFDVGMRHNLPSITVIDENGNMTNVGDRYSGMKRFEARNKISEDLKEKDLCRGEKEHPMTIPICSRTSDVIEPLLKDQWFLDCKEMAEAALKVVENKSLSFCPDYYGKIWNQYLENIRDWCISRQIWWGHRIPAYYCHNIEEENSSGVWICGKNEQDVLKKAEGILQCNMNVISAKQDEDVLDTWFSSALFPFSALGWPERTDDFLKFYPNTILETGKDIFFLWVARMVMMGLKLTDKLPFNEVMLHGLLRDAHGRKMSKSLGNVIDPVDVINGISLQGLQRKVDESNLDSSEIAKAKAAQKLDFPDGIPECGADALRFTLCSYDFKSEEINMDVKHVKSNRNFCNKIWQGFRFVQMNVGEDFIPDRKYERTGHESPIDLWILSRLSYLVEQCDVKFKDFELHHACQNLRTFWQSEFCDVYLECVKKVFQSDCDSRRTSVCQILYTCLETYLKAVSPFMPFVTEELYQRLTPRHEIHPSSICIAEFPRPTEFNFRNPEIENTMNLVEKIANSALSVRTDFNLTKTKIDVSVQVNSDAVKLKLNDFTTPLQTLCRAKSIALTTDVKEIPDGCVSYIVGNYTIHCQLKGIINPEIEEKRLNKKKIKIDNRLQALVAQTTKSDYLLHTSKDTIKNNTKKIGDLEAELEKLSDIIESLKRL